VVPEEHTAPPPLLELDDEAEDDPLDDPDADDEDDEPEDDPDADDDPDAADDDDDADDDPPAEPVEEPDDEPLDDPADPESAPPDDDPLESESSLKSFQLASVTPSPARLSRPPVLTRSEHPTVPTSQEMTPRIPAYAGRPGGKTLLRTISRYLYARTVAMPKEGCPCGRRGAIKNVPRRDVASSY
jgi:hypothetical protein